MASASRGLGASSINLKNSIMFIQNCSFPCLLNRDVVEYELKSDGSASNPEVSVVVHQTVGFPKPSEYSVPALLDAGIPLTAVSPYVFGPANLSEDKVIDVLSSLEPASIPPVDPAPVGSAPDASVDNE